MSYSTIFLLHDEHSDNGDPDYKCVSGSSNVLKILDCGWRVVVKVRTAWTTIGYVFAFYGLFKHILLRNNILQSSQDIDFAELDLLEERLIGSGKSEKLEVSHCRVTKTPTDNIGNIAAIQVPTSGPSKTASGSLWGHLFVANDVTDQEKENLVKNSAKTSNDFDHESAKASAPPKQSSWKPVDQPMWRQGNDSIWEKHQTPYQSTASGKQAGDVLNVNSKDTRNIQVLMPRNEYAQHQHQEEAHQPQCMTVTDKIAEDWFESSEESVEIYEEWYYEERQVLKDDTPQDLASCSTTTGGIQVCRRAAQHWVYPSHIPERKYQLHAISRALFSNTLVCYPTGLGKTLIAAVVMHNFVRWFPKSKAVFIAPTKPLVSQQMKACQNFMGLDVSSASEMTGRAKGDERRAAWHNEAILAYFCTPQTFWNDVKRGICPYEEISCVVVDECHRATGQADVVQAVKYMRNVKKSKFRVLGLSATPGSSREQVQEVIDSLGIHKVVFKNEHDKDVAPYVHNKESEVFVVRPESSGNTSRTLLMASLQRIIGDLSCHGQYYGVADAERVTRYGMQQAKKCYKGGSWSVGQQFIQASILADVRDQLDGYGPKPALAFLQMKMAQDKSLKALYSKDCQFSQFIASLEKSVSQGWCNPKIQKLKEILTQYFQSGSKSGRAIIFATLRDGVSTIIDSLESMKPIVRAKGFIGQGGGGQKGRAGMKQSEQKQVLSEFTSGECNLLVATCIGEEGLDIPNVDLIICFDAISSPTRALQRQGRTGRHGDGRIIYLLTAGQEEERFNKSSQAMNKLHSQLKDAERYFTLSPQAVRMLPREFNPKLAHIALGPGATRREIKDSTNTMNEEEPLAIKLQKMRREMEMKSPNVEQTPKCTAPGGGSMHDPIAPGGGPIHSSVESLQHISRKRRHAFVLHSQSPILQGKDVSSLSVEDVHLIERIARTPTPHKGDGSTSNLVRICKAKKKGTIRRAKVANQSRFIDDEACLSGSDTAEDPDDQEEYDCNLEGFIHDGTPEVGQSPFHPAPQKFSSPSATQMMQAIRSRRTGVLISQSESFRNTPNEYDIDDSFINDQSIEYESGD